MLEQFPRVCLLHDAVARQAELRPDATALLQAGEPVGYRTLNRAADAYAVELLSKGVGPGRLVPVALPRTPQLIAVLLSVLKCGAGYAALDIAWPADRLGDLTRQLDSPIAVGDALQGLGAGAWTPPVETLGQAAARAGAPVSADVDEAAASSVFFTSGTSGAPRGVLSPHRATLRLFAEEPIAGFDHGPVMIQAAPVAWDMFSFEVWGPLITGGTCVLAGVGGFLPEELRQLIAQAGVDTLWLTAALFNLFVDEDIDSFTALRRVFVGGETLSPRHVCAFLRRHPDITLINGYGPVENCVFATTHRIRPEDCERPDGIPIGLPVPGTGVYVFEGGVPAASGTVGEICLSGDGLANGYLGDPEATAERFVTAYVNDRSLRIYRTGDFGSFDSAGVLHFHGRRDRQVKVSGNRVELAEVEAAARRVPVVHDCAVVPVVDPHGGGTRLTLYYTADQDSPRSAPVAVRRALRDVLPRAMVPDIVQQLTALPVTARGKLDRSALRRQPGDASSAARNPPRNAT